MKTEEYKLYYRVFWIFLPNVIKIGPYNFELYRFKVGAFFLRHSVVASVGVYYWATLYWRRLLLPDPYVGPDGVDFICSQEGHDGMTHCATEIPLWTENGVPCNRSVPVDTSDPSVSSKSSCVNWNQHYTLCKTGLSNPYRGSISFDNIGLAWVAIFQVQAFSHALNLNEIHAEPWASITWWTGDMSPIFWNGSYVSSSNQCLK